MDAPAQATASMAGSPLRCPAALQSAMPSTSGCLFEPNFGASRGSSYHEHIRSSHGSRGRERIEDDSFFTGATEFRQATRHTARSVGVQQPRFRPSAAFHHHRVFGGGRSLLSKRGQFSNLAAPLSEHFAPHHPLPSNSMLFKLLRRSDEGEAQTESLQTARGMAWSLGTPPSERTGDRKLEGDLSLEGPSCIFVGPVEAANLYQLEALYLQARDSYYDGHPLILDEMFDKVENQLRWFKSKLVLKYPRCSLKRFSTYADAEADPTQLLLLRSIWAALLAAGILLTVEPSFCALDQMCRDAVQSQLGPWHHPGGVLWPTSILNATAVALVMASLGTTVAAAAARSLQDLLRGSLVALKGCCPSCGEEVYAFVRADESKRPRHKSECHVCEHSLVFHANLEPSPSDPKQLWAHGRIYLVARSKDLAAPRERAQ